MPVTPYHLGPVLLLGILIFPEIYIPGILLGSVIVDIEPFLHISNSLGSHPHGITHTYIGGMFVGILLGLVLFFFRKAIKKFMGMFRLGQDSSLSMIVISSVLGVYSHIVLDSFLYTDIEPFFPSTDNPFYGVVGWFDVYMFCTVTLLLGFFAYIYKLSIKKNGLRGIHR